MFYDLCFIIAGAIAVAKVRNKLIYTNNWGNLQFTIYKVQFNHTDIGRRIYLPV